MRSATVATMGLAMLVCAARPILSATTPETDTKIRMDLLAREFVARVEMYQATVDESGYVSSEPDREAIKPGMPIQIDRVTIGYRSIKIVMRHPKIRNKTWLLFEFSQPLSPDFSREKDTFETRMLPAVFDEKTSDRTHGDGT